VQYEIIHNYSYRNDKDNFSADFHKSDVRKFRVHKPVVEVARDAQCCIHTCDSRCRGQTHRWMDRHCATIRASLACASRAKIHGILQRIQFIGPQPKNRLTKYSRQHVPRYSKPTNYDSTAPSSRICIIILFTETNATKCSQSDCRKILNDIT